MKKYDTPTVTNLNLGTTVIDNEEYEVTGVVPVITAVLMAAAGIAAAVSQEKQAKGGGYMENEYPRSLKKVL